MTEPTDGNDRLGGVGQESLGVAESSLGPETMEQLSRDSGDYIADWHELVSRTNWEKGRIICQWRRQVAGVHPEIKGVSDRAWSELTGGITPDHVGRLRRTYERFGKIHQHYEHLSWTHFMVAVAWEDAEMWLEGASQNRWSVDEMRRTRWEALGAIADQRPAPNELIVDEVIADDSESDSSRNREVDRSISSRDGEVVSGPILEGPDWGDDDSRDSRPSNSIEQAEVERILDTAPRELAQAFQALQSEIQASLEAGWKSIRRRDMLRLIAFLKQVVRS